MIRHFRESPVTITLCALWIALFALMAFQQGFSHIGDNITAQTSRGYGSQSIRGVIEGGEVWRTLTSTFVHFNLLHLGINLFGLYQLGRLLESWYGGPQFLAIYVVIGVLGNAIAVGLKLLLSTWFPEVVAFRDVTSGGGSTVLCGLIALLAVVGWRSRTRFGSVIKTEMIGILLFTAFLGISIPIIDNFGHFGGAVAGVLVGFCHRPMLRIYDRRRIGLLIGGMAALLIVGSGYAQFRIHATPRLTVSTTNEAELKSRLAANLIAARNLNQLALYVRTVVSRHPGHNPWHSLYPLNPSLPDPPAEALRNGLLATLAAIDSVQRQLGPTPSDPCLQRVREMSVQVLEAPLSPGEISEFAECLQALVRVHGEEIARILVILRQLEAESRGGG